MSRLLFAWDRSRSQLRPENRWREVCTLLGLFLAALILCLININEPHLSGNEELRVNWLVNFLNFQFPDINIAWASLQKNIPFHSGWLRLPSAILTALSVPLLYSLAQENCRLRFPALLSGFIYLTTLPVFLYGRMANLHSAILFLEIALFWCGLRSRRDLRWALGVGLTASSLILLNYWTGLLTILGLLAFFAWDTPRLITSGYFWLGSILGSLLPLGGYMGSRLINESQLEQPLFSGIFAHIISFSPEILGISGLKFLIFSLPWLIFLKRGGQLAWRERHWSWAKLVIVWGSIMLLGEVVQPFLGQFAGWLSVYPVFALAVGMVLGQIDQGFSDRFYSPSWSFSLFTLALVAFIGGLGLYFNLFSFFPALFVFAAKQQTILLTIALVLTFTVGGILILRRNRQFIAILAWGMYVSLLLWFSSPYWMILIQ